MLLPRHRWSLQDLDAEWLPTTPPRYNVGLSFDCPIHGTHRLMIRFLEPFDGDAPVHGDGIFALVAENGTLMQLTLMNPSGGDELHFPCANFRVIQGHVELVR